MSKTESTNNTNPTPAVTVMGAATPNSFIPKIYTTINIGLVQNKRNIIIDSIFHGN